MRLRLTVCLITIGCLLVGLEVEANRSGHHKRGKHHGHRQGHRNTWDEKSASRSNKHEVRSLTVRKAKCWDRANNLALYCNAAWHLKLGAAVETFGYDKKWRR